MSSKRNQTATQSLLARAHSPDSASRLFTEKIQYRPLLLRASSPPASSARDERRKARIKKGKERKKALRPKPLSSRQRRKLGLYDVPRDGQKYARFTPLHQLWLGYMRELLGQEPHTGGQGAATKLTSADLHGAEVEVVRSRCVGRVGIKGIVIKDTRFAFEIVAREDTLKIVPKEGTVFRIEIPAAEADRTTPKQDLSQQQAQPDAKSDAMVFDLHGDQFMYRPADRANKKFKTHFLKNI